MDEETESEARPLVVLTALCFVHCFGLALLVGVTGRMSFLRENLKQSSLEQVKEENDVKIG